MLKKASRYAGQSVIGMIGVSVYILADTFFISLGFGTDGLAVLNLTLPVYGLIYALGQMLGIGFAVDFSIRKAQGEDVSSVFMEAVIWNCIFSVPFIVTGICRPDYILKLFGADVQLAAMGRNYIRLVLCGAPLFMINYTFTAFARNDKASMHAMIGSIAGSAYNIIFDYVFMFVFGFGFAGAALATVGCPVVTMLVCGFHFAGKNNTIPFSIRRLSIVRLLKCMSVGTSAFIGEFSNGVISAVYNFLVLGLAGNVGVAAYGVIANIALVCVSILNGIAQGLQPLISEAYGYGKKKEVKDLFAFGLVTAIAVSVLFVILSQLFASPLVAVFNKERNESLRALAIPGIRIYFMGFLAAGVNIVLISYFSAIQNVCIVMIGSMLRGLILIALFAFLLSRMFGITGVWMSFAMAESVTLLMIAFMKKHFGGRQFF